MNPMKKGYCRMFQLAFRLAMPLLPYREPEKFASLESLVTGLSAKHIRCVLLVTDHALRSKGATQALESLFSEHGVCCTVYDKTCPNPTVHNVEEAFSLYKKEKCDALVAFGGGSPIDCAKAVGARVAYPKRNLNRLKGILRIMRKLPPLVAIPTTAGTGSEVTVTSVITDPERKHKYTMNSFPLIPHYAVLDPEVTYTLPPHLTATTGMDALTHAIEAYIGRSTTRETRKLATDAAKLIFENIEKAYHENTNRNARENMLHAAYKAGIAFSKSYVGYIHAVAHSLGGQYNIPHGMANSVLLPIVLREYGACVHKKLHQLAVAVGISTVSDTHAEGAEKLISAIETLNVRLGIPKKLSGIRKEDIPVMAKHADKEANPLYPVPRLMNAKELETLYKIVADWSNNDDN